MLKLCLWYDVCSSSGTDAADVGDEQDHQEKSVRVSFVQELLISTLFEEMWP